MLKTFLKIFALAGILLFTANSTYAQLYQKFPTNVRYIGGGFNNVRPFFKTLEAALNDVKPFATSSNPYGFWIASDTLWIADWDSVFTESGYTMKDSIDIYYVATGKIKWLPFGFGGEGSGGNFNIIAQDDITLHYDWPTWDQENIALPLWQRQMGAALDSVDEEVWRLIVYTKSPLYIENDTLKIDTSGLGGGGTGWNPDTTTILRTTGDQTFTGIKTNAGTLRNTGTLDFSGSGNIQIPSSNGATGQPRRIWGDTDKIFYSGSGAGGDTNYTAMINNTTKYLECDTCITPDNLNDDTKAFFTKSGSATFSGANTSLTVSLPGATSSSYIIATAVYSDSSTSINDNDQLVVVPFSSGFHIKRKSGGTSNLKVNWAWIKQ